MGDHLTVDFDSDEGDYTDYATDAPLPTPSGTPYRTPHLSRHHSRHATPSPTPSPYPASSSPPTTNGGRVSPLHRINTGHQQHHHHPLHHHDRAFDETISILDPRRFTPTLHANLVAEILSLRRELESKSNLVDTLEQDLHAARDEHETAATSVVTAQREARDIKRQLARAENDDAVEAVAKERDEAVNAVAELKRQVERLTKSRRSAEDDLERTKKMAEQDNEEHEAVKRSLERRAHIAEGRLKALLDELAAADSMQPPPPPPQEPVESDHEDATQSEVEQSDATSIQGSVRDSYHGRPASWKMGDDEAERLGIRFSVVAANTGKSLADELNFDEEDEDDEEGLEEYDEEDDDQTAEFSFTEDNASAFLGNASDNGLGSEVEGEEEHEMTEYHEMGVQVDFDDTQEQEDQNQEDQNQEQQQQLHKESEQQVERLDILGLEIEEKLAELERTYVELDRKTVELDSIYNEVERAHYRIIELEDHVEKMDEQASEREEVISNLKRDHAEEIKLFEARGKEVEERWTMLQTQEISFSQIEDTLQKRSKDLDDREALVIAASIPITIENNTIERSLDERSQNLDKRQTSLDERSQNLDKRQITLNEKEADLDVFERKVSDQKSTLHEQEKNLVKQKTALDEREINLNEQETTLNDQKTILGERNRSLDQQEVALEKQRIEWEKNMDEQKTSICDQEKNLDEKKAALDEKEVELDEREAELDDQVTTIVERKSSLDRREMNLNQRQKTLEERERSLNDTETILEERERNIEEREAFVVATTTPIVIDDKEFKTKADTSLAEVEAKEREGEYEANERRKRSRSTGVSSPTPFSPQVATFSTPIYASCGSQTSPSYTSVESQTSPPYVSVEAQASPAYVSVEAQVSPAYISVEAQASPVYVSVDAQANPAYVSIDTQVNPAYVSVEAQTSPPYVSTEVQTSSSYVSVEVQTSSSYISAETQCIPLSYVSVDLQTTPPYVSVESQITPVYVSTESQTDEPTPPPIPPRRASPPTPPPVVQTQTIGIQTDPMKPPPLPRIIPTIAVIPPPPTPPLPPPPPPVMKSAAVQTRSKPRVRSRSMQTEEIRLDERIMKLPPHLHPSAIMANNPLPPAPNPTHPVRSDAPPPSPPKKSLRRSMVKRTSAMGPTSVPTSGLPPRSVPITDDSPGSAFIYNSPPRVDSYGETSEKDKESVRRHLFNGVDFHDVPQSSGDEFLDDADLSANEFKTALSAPKPKKPRNTPHVNLNKPSPIETTFPKPIGGLQRKGATIRKTALISSSSHNRARSPSFESSRNNENGGTKIGPPFPVPARHSSRKPGGYGGQSRTESPTPMSATLPKRATQTKHTRQQSVQSIRKVRSATALPNLRTSNGRNRSPPPLSASSAAPDSPSLPQHRDDMRSSAFNRPRYGSIKHKHAESTNTSNSATTAGNASVGSVIQQTSVVDAIAQTMVGEWMWKYVRRRKSFGVAESPQNWDRDESAGGQRHKRWVWLAPYERAVMWSSRQPTSGNALLGKSGRKLPIQSVLDVKDDTPLPKGADPAKPLFNRSILILTPARALKFTAPNKERHYVWLTALSFLSHSPQGGEGLLALPPPMPFEYEQVQHQQPVAPPRPPVPPIPMHRDVPFHPVRDSIRLAKGKSRQKAQKVNGFPPRNDSIREVESIRSAGSVAEPPSIPRFPGQHARKRSNSAVRPGTQRSTSNGYDPSVLSSYGGSNNGDYYGGPMIGVGGIGIVSGNSSMLSGHPGAPLGGWDTGPVGTVRMEAFVERPTRYEFDEEDEYHGPSSYRLRRDRRSSRQESYWSGSGDFYAGSGAGPVEDEGFWRGEDPFGGF